MDKRTVSSAHLRIDGLEKDVIALQTEVRIQCKEVFTRIKRIEAILLSASGATILMLIAILTKMG
ncbi:MAG: hypothetical protein CMJ25_06365 [Phycisphaerae bacterium]|nr:hypothetical protein [Phycisphaerae bacterium]